MTASLLKKGCNFCRPASAGIRRNSIHRILILVLLLVLCDSLLSAEPNLVKTKPQNDLGFVVGLGFQGNGELQDRLHRHYSSEGWSGSGSPGQWVVIDLGLQCKTIHYLYVTPGVKTLYSSVNKAIEWTLGDMGYSQDVSDVILMLTPTVSMKYILFHKGLHSFTINGMLSTPKWISGPEEGFYVVSDGFEKGIFVGYEFGNSISKKLRSGYAKAVDRKSRHIVFEAGYSTIPMSVNSVTCDVGGVFVNLKGYFGFMDWR